MKGLKSERAGVQDSGAAADLIEEQLPEEGAVRSPSKATHYVAPEKTRPFDLVEVKSGDTLCTILRQRLQLPDHLIFNEAINQVKALNSQIRDLNLIRPGQRLVIPLYASTTVAGSSGATAVTELAAADPAAVNSKPSVSSPMKGLKSERARVRDSGASADLTEEQLSEQSGVGTHTEATDAMASEKTRLASAPGPEEQRIQILADALMATVIALGGKSLNKGLYFLPLRGQAQITLKCNHFPLLEFPGGDSVFLDLNDRLSATLEESIRDIWEGRYQVVNVRDTDNFRSIWQQVTGNLTQMELWTDGGPLFIHEPIEISVRGDWILTASKPPRQGRKIFVVNLLEDTQERTDPALQTYLDSLGIRVVDVQLRGQLERPRVTAPLNEGVFERHSRSVVARSRSAPDLVEALLRSLEQPYQRDASVTLLSEAQDAITVSVQAGIYFKRYGESHLIYFGKLYPPLLTILKERQFEVLVLEPSWSPPLVLEAMIAHLQLDANSSYTFSASQRDPKRNIRLSLPGDLIQEEKQSHLLTSVALSASLEHFLQRQGVRVLLYPTR
jgi:hypothetical protein